MVAADLTAATCVGEVEGFLADMRGLIESGDLAGVQRAVRKHSALLDAKASESYTPLMWALGANSWGEPAIAD